MAGRQQDLCFPPVPPPPQTCQAGDGLAFVNKVQSLPENVPFRLTPSSKTDFAEAEGSTDNSVNVTDGRAIGQVYK